MKAITIEEAAKILKVSEDTVYRHIRSRRLRVLPRIVANMEGEPLTSDGLIKLAKTFPNVGRPKEKKT